MRGRDRSRIAAEFALFDDTLIRLRATLYPVKAILAFGRKQLGDGVDAPCRTAAIARAVQHALTDLEVVIAQVISIRKMSRKELLFNEVLETIMQSAGKGSFAADVGGEPSCSGRQASRTS